MWQDFKKVTRSFLYEKQTKDSTSDKLNPDFINSYKNINGWYFGTRPTVFVDPYDKEDKTYSYKMMVRYLKEGYNFMIYPEAVWNLSEIC